jgi:hypothetical protein
MTSALCRQNNTTSSPTLLDQRRSSMKKKKKIIYIASQSLLDLEETMNDMAKEEQA